MNMVSPNHWTTKWEKIRCIEANAAGSEQSTKGMVRLAPVTCPRACRTNISGGTNIGGRSISRGYSLHLRNSYRSGKVIEPIGKIQAIG